MVANGMLAGGGTAMGDIKGSHFCELKVVDKYAPDRDFDKVEDMKNFITEELEYEVIDCGDGVEGCAIQANPEAKPKIIIGAYTEFNDSPHFSKGATRAT
jgi:hypothetical protein